MLTAHIPSEKIGEIFPHMERLLLCGWFTHHVPSGQSWWSEGVYCILGLEPFSVTCNAELMLNMVDESDKAGFVLSLKKTRDQLTPVSYEFSITDANGQFRRLHAETFIRETEPDSYEGVIRDVTENYSYKQALENKVRQLDKSNQNLQEFVYIASHDLQEPLRKISTFSGRLQSRFKHQLAEEGSAYLERILKSTSNMQILLEDLLSFSRLSFTDRNYAAVDLEKCLSSVLSDLEVMIEESSAIIKTEPLPVIDGFQSQICQLFNNLLSNSLKFRKPGEPARISISVQQIPGGVKSNSRSDEKVRIRFSDEGIGFEQEYAEKIFMIFQRLNGRSEYSGSGVGLSICRRIVENHHGTISAESEPGRGATFTIILPVKQQNQK